jgi:zinc and cadmium transporter
MSAYLYLTLSVAAGAGVAFALNNTRNGLVKFLLTFSGAYLLSIGVFHLLPEIYEGHDHTIGIFIMVGFFIQLFLEFFSKGMEHGHKHVDQLTSGVLPVSILIALFIHALLESLPIGMHAGHAHENTMLWAVVIHKFPVTVIYTTMLLQLKLSKTKVAIGLILFAIVAPIGVWLGEAAPFVQTYSREITAVVLGLFLHISTTILFESSASHKFNFQKLFVIVLAVLVAWFSSVH